MIWSNVSEEIREFVMKLLDQIQEVIEQDSVGYYLHGSLAIGGFNPTRSDIDLLVITKHALSLEDKIFLTELFLKTSNNPYPIEISFLNRTQLDPWVYPTAYDYHFSEFWRERYEQNKERWLVGENTDADLAAHITITNYKGICLKGESIEMVFPIIPKNDYIASILGDYKDCLNDIEEKPVYCILNMLRVYRFLKDGVISSKLEAGNWGVNYLPHKHRLIVNNAINAYTEERSDLRFKIKMLEEYKEYINKEVNSLLS